MKPYYKKCCLDYIDNNLFVEDGEVKEITCNCGQKIIGFWGDVYGLWLPKSVKKEDYKPIK